MANCKVAGLLFTGKHFWNRKCRKFWGRVNKKLLSFHNLNRLLQLIILLLWNHDFLRRLFIQLHLEIWLDAFSMNIISIRRNGRSSA